MRLLNPFVERANAWAALVSLLVFHLSLLSFAQEETAPSKPQKFDSQTLGKILEQRVKELDSNKLKDRDQSEAAIVALGPQVIDLLPPVSDADSEEFRMRIERVRRQLEKQEKAQLTTPSYVNLSGVMSGADALTKISEMTGNKIELEGVANLTKSVTTAFDKTPFWEAFDEVLDQLGLTVASGDGEDIRLIPLPEAAPLRIETAGYSGVFRLEPMMINKVSNLQDPTNSYLTIDVLFSWEPRINPSLIKFQTEGMELVCDNGEILTPSSDAELEFAPVGGSQMQASLMVQMPTREAKRIAKWNGKVFATLPGKLASVAFTDLMNTSNKTLTNGMLSVTLEQARKNRDIYEVLVGVSLKASEDGKGSVQSWASLQDVFMFDKDLKRIENVGWSTTRMGENDVGMSYVFEKEGDLKGCKFIFRAPGSLNEEEIDFELVDIPLP